MKARKPHYTFKLHGRKGHYYWNLIYTGADGVGLMVATGVPMYTTKLKAISAIEKFKLLAPYATIEDIAP